ncbi:hypothetical protein D0T51_00005 [Parabacteroides sp. 52]|uniref:hypothetical protein n=1 Tax=Parabacteroides sp. PM5-20 TaxID=2940527 RepID=UPI001EC2AEB4|nr:hypothetical protein [Parabacteroides sp. PM5-20]MDH6533361.1 hypothetical protein [Parabacteroides sp. PM5-20]NDV54120.1 hypothetical protein [Parabacteroides sp. 52]
MTLLKGINFNWQTGAISIGGGDQFRLANRGQRGEDFPPVKNLFFCLNLAELEELKTLLFIHKRKEDPCEKQLALLHIFAN